MFGPEPQPQYRRLVAVPGLLDLTTAPALKVKLLGMLRPGLHLIVELDLTGQIDSSGLAVLVAVQKRLERVGGRLVVVIADGHVADKFEAVGLDRVLTIARSRDEAIAIGQNGDAPGGISDDIAWGTRIRA